MSTVTLQEAVPAYASHHFVRVTAREGSDAETNILENFDMNAAQPKSHERTKYWVSDASRHQFDPSENHRLDNDPVHGIAFVVSRRPRLNVVKGPSHCSFIVQI